MSSVVFVMEETLIPNVENKLGLMRQMLTDNNVNEKEFNDCFNNIIDDLSDYIDCSKVRIPIENEVITWNDVKGSGNYSDKFIFAKTLLFKFIEKFERARDYSQENLLFELDADLVWCTNVKNIYFDVVDTSSMYGDKLFNRVLKSRYKSFNAIFKEEIRFLAYDFRKFIDIDKLSKHCANIHDDSMIKINQKQGLKLYEIGELVYNGKLEKAHKELHKFIRDEHLPERYIL